MSESKAFFFPVSFSAGITLFILLLAWQNIASSSALVILSGRFLDKDGDSSPPNSQNFLGWKNLSIFQFKIKLIFVFFLGNICRFKIWGLYNCYYWLMPNAHWVCKLILLNSLLQILVETGLIGRQASGSVTVTDGETVSYELSVKACCV